MTRQLREPEEHRRWHLNLLQTDGLKDRFWAKVAIPTNTNDCWEWTAAKNRGGYGMLAAWLPGERMTALLAPRVAWFVAHGTLPGVGRYVLHTCDHPSCVNPAHLFEGTTADNMRDKVVKGRQARGEDHGSAKLSLGQAALILWMSRFCRSGRRHLTWPQLAQPFGVSPRLARAIAIGEKWGLSADGMVV